MSGEMSSWRVLLCVWALVAAVTLALFSPSLGHSFLRYDDQLYVYENPFVRSPDAASVGWIFTHAWFKSYTPLTLLAHAADFRLWGMDPGPHHAVSVFLHGLNAGWVFLLVLGVLTAPGWRGDPARGGALPLWAVAAASALFFSLHPLRVESAAWVAGRKDLLAGFFALPALIAYIRFLEKGSRLWYLVALACTILASLAKTSAAALPLAMAGLDLLRRGNLPLRARAAASFLRVLPILGAAGCIGVFAYSLAGTGGAHYALGAPSAWERAVLPLYTVSFYLAKTLVPAGLAPVYLFPGTFPLAAGSVAALVVLWGGILSVRRKDAITAAGLLLFLSFLIPTMAGLSAGIQPWA
ncbi:MAG: hypothetical protein WB626_08575, partial [Bacteroidota bacterium]